jgi:F-type H+-transporting ATPase subunit gamma
MATLRDIKQRITGISKTQQITKAMKMVAAAKLRRAQNNILSARPFAYELADLLRHMVGLVDVSLNPLLQAREAESVCVVIVTSDRGLCGGFNSNLLRAASVYIDERYGTLRGQGKLSLVCVGKKGADYYNRRGYAVHRQYTGLMNKLNFSDAQDIVEDLRNDYLEGEFDRIEIVYNEFKSIVLPKITFEQFLPISPVEIAEKPKSRAVVDYIYEPSPEAIVNKLIPKHLDTHFWRILLESKAAEEGSRMAAMDAATENAKDLIRTLNLTYNKARQTAITTEIMEIVGGANALEGGG